MYRLQIAHIIKSHIEKNTAIQQVYDTDIQKRLPDQEASYERIKRNSELELTTNEAKKNAELKHNLPTYAAI
jgi:Na+-transporting NADH:ubiquinone oxidoreductase subunit NqrC